VAGQWEYAELDTCSCGPWINLVMCIWPSSVAWLHPLVLSSGFRTFFWSRTICGSRTVTTCSTWGVGKGRHRPPLWILKCAAQKLVFEWEQNNFYHFCPHPLRKFFGKINWWPPPGKNPSDVRGTMYQLVPGKPNRPNNIRSEVRKIRLDTKAACTKWRWENNGHC